MKIDNIFNDADEQTINQISEEYPVLTDEEKERILRMILQNKDDDSEDSDSVSGVEIHKPRKISRIFTRTVAAASILLIAGCVYQNYKRNMRDNPLKPQIYSTEECEKTAEEAIGEFYDALNVFLCGTESVDKENSLVFYNYSEKCPEWEKGDIRYFKVNDSGFRSRSELFGYISRLVTEDYLTTLKNEGCVLTDESLFQLADIYDSKNYPTFIQFGNSLYCAEKTENAALIPDTEITVSKKGDYEFSAVCSDKLEVQFVWYDDEWRINNIERITK